MSKERKGRLFLQLMSSSSTSSLSLGFRPPSQADTRHPDLEPRLDVYSIVYSITYIDVKDRPSNSFGQLPSTEPHRLLLPSSPTPGRLPLHLLHISLADGLRASIIHPYFDPIIFRLSSSDPQTLSSTRADFRIWTRLRELIFEDAFLYIGLLHTRITRSTCNGGNLKVSYVLSSEETDDDPMIWVSADLDTEGERYEQEGSVIGEVVVKLCTKEQKEFLLGDLEGSLILPKLTIIVKEYVEFSFVSLQSSLTSIAQQTIHCIVYLRSYGPLRALLLSPSFVSLSLPPFPNSILGPRS